MKKHSLYHNHRIRQLALLLLALFLMTCSRKKNTALSRAYHNTTSHYNGYFNAREIMKTNEKTLKETQVDDYSQILPVFVYPSEQISQGMYPDMDKIIEKCSEVINRHSIYKKKKEHIKWIDDSYLLIGKARFYKQEYTLAEETFLYIYQAFKKEPNRYAGLNWLIRTYIETEQWDKAEEFLDLADDEKKKYPDELKGDFLAALADFHLQNGNRLHLAIPALEDAVIFSKKKDQRRRLNFVLAQLYQDQGNYNLASQLYSKVIKMNPSYVMQFNARINRAISYDVSANNSDDIKKELRKMLKDKKNEEFRDQIYYALAELALKENDEPLAVKYLRNSAKYSTSNTKQKALSYFKLAELYFARPDYVQAQAHYDSTLQFLPDDHPYYYEADNKNNNLQDLVANLKTIQLQDSLLALGELSEKDREKAIKKLIQNIKEEEEQRKQAEMRALEREQSQSNLAGNFNTGGGRTKGQWYFYNQTTMALGLSEFKQTWGERKLEDHWNRSKRNTLIVNQNIQEEEKTPEELKQDSIQEAEKYSPAAYLKDIPVDFKDQLLAHGKIVDALFNVGTIFKESFLDYPSAIKAFQRITETYDTSAYNLPAHYQLYRIYVARDEDELAAAEKKWVLESHPFSEYAYLIKNPNYSKESKETKQKVEEFYQATYKLYDYELYKDVIESCDRAEGAFKKNHLKAQFAFLKAKSIGYTQDKGSFKKALEEVVEKFENEPVADEAKRILAFMGQQVKSEEALASYIYNPSQQHLFVFTFSKEKDNNQLKNKLSDFNRQYFRERKLEITATVLKGSSQLLVRTFASEAEAMRYFKAVRNNTGLILLARQMGAEEYLISLENFRTLFKNKDEMAYRSFF